MLKTIQQGETHLAPALGCVTQHHYYVHFHLCHIIKTGIVVVVTGVAATAATSTRYVFLLILGLLSVVSQDS